MKKIISLTLILGLLVSGSFIIFEPQITQAVTDQSVITQTVTAGISITDASDETMSRALTMTDNTAVGDILWNVKTNNQAGYSLSISASSTSGCADRASDGTYDALCNLSTGEAFQDMATSSRATWIVSNNYKFGFSAFGTQTTGYGTDTDCIAAAHVPSAGLLYQGFNGTNLIQIASSTSETTTAGIDTTLCLGVGQDTTYAPSGTYTATTTATAVVN